MLLSSKVVNEAKGNEKSCLLYSDNQVLSPVKIKEFVSERGGWQRKQTQGDQKKSFQAKFKSFGLKHLAPSGITLLKRVASSSWN